MPKEVPSWAHKKVDLVPLHPVVGFVLQVGDAKKFLHTLGIERLDPFFFPVSKQSPEPQAAVSRILPSITAIFGYAVDLSKIAS